MKAFILTLAFLSILATQSYGQELIDTEGKDFYLTFLPNYHNNKSVNITDSLYIFISSKVPTKGTITYYNRNGAEYKRNFNIIDPNKIYTFATTFKNFELEGFNDSGTLVGNSQNEKIAKQSFHVESEQDVTIYALNQASLTSEAFLVIPTDALGKEYYVMAYNSDGKTAGFSLTGASTPSQFVIVATKDSTVVEIQPSSATYVNGFSTQRKILQRGEVYLVQSLISPTNLYNDLTGSLIRSSEPIAVFAGHQRASLPFDMFSSASRDHLVEQMLPVKSWGLNAIVVPFVQPNSAMAAGYDIVRIMAANDNTKVKIRNSTVNINAGETYEFKLDEALFIEADQPILVAQYKKSSSNNSTSSSSISDPLMLLIPPVEQYISSYRVINVQGKGVNSLDQLIRAYDEQYITVIIEKNYVDDVVLDGNKVNAGLFEQVENTDYYWANLRVSDGVHNISSEGRFAVFVYGYGVANSYGYLGGMGMLELDLVPPNISAAIDCFKAIGAATDSNLTDSRLYSVKLTSSTNTNVKIEDFVPYKPVVRYEAELKNKYLDGKYSITAIDSSGMITEKTFDIPGFTIDAKDHYSESAIIYKHLSYQIDTLMCFDIDLYNYGKHPTNINKIYFKNFPNLFKKNEPDEFIINPGEKKTLTFCVSYSDEFKFTDTLVIGNDCAEREVVAVLLEFFEDKLPPLTAETADSCNNYFIYEFNDDREFDKGVDKCEIILNINCDINIERVGNSNLKVTVRIIDPSSDAEFKLLVYDRSGNKVNIEKIVPGYTIQLTANNENLLKYEATLIGELKCKSINLYNYGKYAISFDKIYLLNNTIFSVPQSQLPLKIEAGKSKELNICFTPNSAIDSVLRDTLVIDYNCIANKLPLVGIAEPWEFTADSKCDVAVALRTKAISNTISVYPSPIVNRGNIEFGVSEEADVKILIFNVLGELVDTLFETDKASGQLSISFDATQFSSGAYIIQIKIGNSLINYPIMIFN